MISPRHVWAVSFFLSQTIPSNVVANALIQGIPGWDCQAMGRPASAHQHVPMPPSRTLTIFLGLFPSLEGLCRESIVCHAVLRTATPANLLVSDAPSRPLPAHLTPQSHFPPELNFQLLTLLWESHTLPVELSTFCKNWRLPRIVVKNIFVVYLADTSLPHCLPSRRWIPRTGISTSKEISLYNFDQCFQITHERTSVYIPPPVVVCLLGLRLLVHRGGFNDWLLWRQSHIFQWKGPDKGSTNIFIKLRPQNSYFFFSIYLLLYLETA